MSRRNAADPIESLQANGAFVADFDKIVAAHNLVADRIPDRVRNESIATFQLPIKPGRRTKTDMRMIHIGLNQCDIDAGLEVNADYVRGCMNRTSAKAIGARVKCPEGDDI